MFYAGHQYFPRYRTIDGLNKINRSHLLDLREKFIAAPENGNAETVSCIEMRSYQLSERALSRRSSYISIILEMHQKLL